MYPSDPGIYPSDDLYKSRIVHLYYSSSRFLHKAWGTHFSPSSPNYIMIIIITPAATASPSCHNAKPPSSAAARLALPSPADKTAAFRLFPLPSRCCLYPPPLSAIACHHLLPFAATTVHCLPPTVVSQSKMLSSITSTPVVLWFVLQMACNQPAHLLM